MSNVRISEYYVIFIYFQAAASAQLAVSVLYIEKILRNIRDSRFRQISKLSNEKPKHFLIAPFTKEIFKACNFLPFSCTHLALSIKARG